VARIVLGKGEDDMSTTAAGEAQGIDDLPPWVRRTWTIPLVIGILMLILGLVLLFNINASIGTLRWLVVLSLVFAAVEAFATASLRQKPWVGWLVGFAYIVGAILSIAWPGVTLLALVLVVGASFLVGGIVEAVMAWQARNVAKGWGWSFALGLLSVVAGLAFLFGSPVVSLVVLAILLAIYVIMAGVTLVILALAVRKAATALAGPALA
jgi:uncharacterized membrane protein HdeD (DUF308 family)